MRNCLTDTNWSSSLWDFGFSSRNSCETLHFSSPFAWKSGFSSSSVSGAQTSSARCWSSSTAERCLSSGTSAWYRDPIFIRLGTEGRRCERPRGFRLFQNPSTLKAPGSPFKTCGSRRPVLVSEWSSCFIHEILFWFLAFLSFFPRPWSLNSRSETLSFESLLSAGSLVCS